MDEVDSTTQALMRLINIRKTRETNEERLKRLVREEEYNNVLDDMGVKNNFDDAVSFYTGGW